VKKPPQVNISSKPQAVSLFSGCGGFDLGARKAGIDIIWANDIDSHAAAAYKKLLPDVDFHLGDIRKVREFPKADILIGCYPCTGFSQAAKRRSGENEEPRDLKANPGNFLFREFLRALRHVKPKFLIVENVKGMLTASNGWFLERQLCGFRRHGFTVKAKLLMAADYGVPQLRQRVFLVGVHESVKNFDYEFPSPTHGPSGKQPWKVLRDVLTDGPLGADDDYIKKPFHGHYLTRPRKKNWDEPSYTIVAHGSHVPLHPSGKKMISIGKDSYELQGTVNRRLSWRECAILQGLPKRIKVPGGLMAKYRVIGNAVPPSLARALLKPIAEKLSTKLISG